MVLAFEVETIWADTAKFTNVIVAGFRNCSAEIWSEKVTCSSK